MAGGGKSTVWGHGAGRAGLKNLMHVPAGSVSGQLCTHLPVLLLPHRVKADQYENIYSECQPVGMLLAADEVVPASGGRATAAGRAGLKNLTSVPAEVPQVSKAVRCCADPLLLSCGRCAEVLKIRLLLLVASCLSDVPAAVLRSGVQSWVHWIL